jgi:hypothetical protein
LFSPSLSQHTTPTIGPISMLSCYLQPKTNDQLISISTCHSQPFIQRLLDLLPLWRHGLLFLWHAFTFCRKYIFLSADRVMIMIKKLPSMTARTTKQEQSKAIIMVAEGGFSTRLIVTTTKPSSALSRISTINQLCVASCCIHHTSIA